MVPAWLGCACPALGSWRQLGPLAACLLQEPQPVSGTARVVIDLTSPAGTWKICSLPKAAATPHVLCLECVSCSSVPERQACARGSAGPIPSSSAGSSAFWSATAQATAPVGCRGDAKGELLWSGPLQSHSSLSHQPILTAAPHDTGDTQQDWDVVTGLTESRSSFHRVFALMLSMWVFQNQKLCNHCYYGTSYCVVNPVPQHSPCWGSHCAQLPPFLPHPSLSPAVTLMSLSPWQVS